MTIKVSEEKMKEIYDFDEKWLKGEIDWHGETKFLFDKYCLVIYQKNGSRTEYNIRYDIKDAFMKARVRQLIDTVIEGQTIKEERTATITHYEGGEFKLANMNDAFKEFLRMKKKYDKQNNIVNEEGDYKAMLAAAYEYDIAAVEAYIMYKLENREIIFKESVKEHKPRLSEKAIKQSQKNEGKDIILNLEEAIRYIKKKGLHKIHCECWGVRGHYRHYKNGKTVFIKAYQKGKKRNEKKVDKTYIV